MTALRRAVAADFKRLRLRQTGDEATREAVMRDLLARVTDEDVPTLARLLTPSERESEFGTAVVAHWLNVDPAGAVAWLQSGNMPGGAQAQDIGRRLQSAALDQVSVGLPPGAAKDGILAGAATAIVDRAPERARTLAEQMQSGPTQTDVLETIAYAWSVKNPVNAAHWIASIPDAGLRDNLIATGAKALGTTDPEVAIGWTTLLPPGDARNQAQLAIAETWAASDPSAAGRWVAGLGDSTARDAAVTTILSRWSVADPSAATAWLLSLPDHTRQLARLEQARLDRLEPKP
ncbi:MAG TPA: hypothetical protein VHE61_09535 [Opitutaceae bacterium]|nr:hypothetical protein [Opitutaceae bacterium]